MDNFVAIDFETANNDRRSACAVGMAVVRNGAVAEVYSSLIRPPSICSWDKYSYLHGITPESVQDAPTFADIYPEIQRRCDGRIIAAHNTAFDMTVLSRCTDHYGFPSLSGRSICTLRLAQALMPDLPNHQLNTLAERCGIPLKHHEAQSDAIACAELGIRLWPIAGTRISEHLRPLE